MDAQPGIQALALENGQVLQLGLDQHRGLGRLLVEEAERDAGDMMGVAVVTSDKAFMANRSLFAKNGYAIVAESDKDQLLAKQFSDGPPPSINDWQAELEKYEDLTIVYSKQCPWIARFMQEIKPILEEKELKISIREIENAAQAQKAPSLYGAFNLIHNRKLPADRYISTTRFLNILKKELGA